MLVRIGNKLFTESVFLAGLFLILFSVNLQAQQISDSLVGKNVQLITKENNKLFGLIVSVEKENIVLYSQRNYDTILQNNILSYKIIADDKISNYISDDGDYDYYNFSSPTAIPLAKKEFRVRGPFVIPTVFDYGLSNKFSWQFGTSLGLIYGTGITYREKINSKNTFGISFSGAIPLVDISTGLLMARTFYSYKAGKNLLTIGYTLAVADEQYFHIPSISFSRKLDKRTTFINELYAVFPFTEYLYIDNLAFRVLNKRGNSWNFGLVMIISNEIITDPFRSNIFILPLVGYHAKIGSRR